jgi:hypothetical protein
MIAVVLVGVLGVIATVAYRRITRASYMAEANEMVVHIRGAQEAFRAENGGYLQVSGGLGPGFDYPLTTPGPKKTAWGGPCTGCIDSVRGWSALNVSSTAPLAFGYSTVTSDKTVLPPLWVNGTNIVATGMPAPWYIIEADGDMDGNGVFCRVYGLSGVNQLYVDHEGE